ncbi:MAG: UDP-N-acetylmuramate dehydrogenase [Caulobacteraceae bacterium]
MDPRHLPPARGKLLIGESLAPFTWFRVGGPAEILLLPADEADLAVFLAALDPDIPVTTLGAASNVIVRDGGIAGVVVRLAGRAFGEVVADPTTGQVTAAAGALDAAVARAAAAAGLAGLEFLAGIPGTVGGALTMNAGCYGREIEDVLAAAWALDRSGAALAFDPASMGLRYRGNGAPPGLTWMGAVFQGTPGDPTAIAARMATITRRRGETQPIRERTGGSTFRNPPGDSAWRLVDAAGWRGRAVGAATMSPLHANFMIAGEGATAADLEALGEAVRADVTAKFAVDLEWEIKRLGRK